MSAAPAKIPPKPGKSTIYVDVEDEITSIIDKVENAKEPVVALVLPKRATALQSIVNMRLLHRAATSDNKKVVLVTSEEALLPLAGAAGLHVASSLDSQPEIPAAPAALKAASAATKAKVAPASSLEVNDNSSDLPTKIDYNKTVGGLAAAHDAENPETIELEDGDHQPAKDSKVASGPKLPIDKKVKVPNFDRFRLMLGLGAAAIVALIIFIILAASVLPKATITLTTTSVPVSANFNLTTSGTATALDESAGIIPAVSKTSQETATAQVTATGQQNNGTKATGSVTMTAQECAPTIHTPANVPAGTGIISGGLTYITQTTTGGFAPTGGSGSCVNYSASSSTNITAQTGGSKANVSGATFSVSGRSDVSASGSASGGTDNIVTVVSQNDVDGAKSTITTANAATFTTAFENQLKGQGYYVLTSTMNAGNPVLTASPAVGQAASATTVTEQITYTVMAIKTADLTKAITDTLSKQIDKSKQTVSTSNLLKNATVTVASQSSPTVASLTIAEDTTAVPIINVASVKAESAGQKTGDITTALGNIPGVKSVKVNLSPFWVSKVPKKPGKITVVQQQVKS